MTQACTGGFAQLGEGDPQERAAFSASHVQEAVWTLAHVTNAHVRVRGALFRGEVPPTFH